MNNFFFSLLCATLLVFIASNSHCEFYEFVDENGVKTFTDDPGIIPESKTDETQVHKEPYDDLSDEERQEKIKADQERILELKRQQEEEHERYEQIKQIRAMEEEKIQRQKELEKLKTPVMISNNQILVPVTIGYLNKTVQSTLVLDTGASITVIHDDIADQLGVTTGRRSYAQVAGGGIVRTKNLEVKFIKVGPKTLSSHNIMVMHNKGPKSSIDGLLGLDFLKHFKYDIDYQNNLIVWKE